MQLAPALTLARDPGGLDTVRGPTHEPSRGPDWDGAFPRLLQKFEEAEDVSFENRSKAERDIDYFDGKQLTVAEKRALEKRGQPPVVKNRIRRKVKYLQGLEKSARTDPKAVPRSPQREQDAYAASAALRYVSDTSRYDQIRSRAFKDIVSAGWGGTEIVVEHRPGETNPRVVVRRCQWDRMFWDPYSAEEDFSDATYLGLVIWMDRDEAVRKYGPDAATVYDETTATFGEFGSTFDDKPKQFTWVSYDKQRFRVRVVQMYFQDPGTGQWCFAEFTKGGYLKAGVSPWLDENGEPEHPYEWGSANVDRDNNRYGEIRDMIDTQDAINKRESRFLHQVSVRQTFRTQGSLGRMTPRQLREQLARPDGDIEMAPGMEFGKHFGIIPTMDMAQAQFHLLEAANAEMDLIGPNASMSGKGGGDQSGRAILANQQGGTVEIGTLTDTLKDLDIRTYRKVWKRIRQFWTGEQWVSVTDDLKNLKWVGLNATKKQPMMVPTPQGPQPMVDPSTGQPAMQPVFDPATGQPVMENPVSQLDVNITFDDAPQMGTLQDEQFKMLVQLKGMDANGEIPFKAIIMAAPNLQAKQAILEAIEQRESAPPDPMVEAAKKATLDNKNADTASKLGQAAHQEALAHREHVGRGIDLADAIVPQRPAPAPIQPMQGF